MGFKMKKHSIFIAIACVIQLLSFQISYADNSGDKMMEAIVVTATKTAENVFDVPASVSVINSSELSKKQDQSLGDALEDVPGLSIESAGSWEASPVIRGLGGSRVLVLFDGDRETNLWAGRAPLTPFADMGNIARVEVLKGPASALYGSDALGGVINVITKDALLSKGDEWKLENTVNTRFSSVDNGIYGRYSIAAGGKGVGLRFGISARDADNYEDGDGDEVRNSQYENYAVDFKASYELKKGHKAEFEYRLNNITDFGIPQKNGDAPFSHFDKFNTTVYKLKYSVKELGIFKDAALKAYYVDQTRSFEGNFPSSDGKKYNIKENDIDTSAKGASYQMTYENSKHKITSGFEIVQEETDSEETQLISKTNGDPARKFEFKPVPDAKRLHAGIFGQDEIFFTDKFIAVIGGRYDYFSADADDVIFRDTKYKTGGAVKSASESLNDFSAETDSAASLNIGLLYEVNSSLHLTSNLSTGFRAPDIFELYSTRGGGSMVLIGNPELDPERSYNVDFGIKTKSKRVQSSASLFYNRVYDYIDTVLQSTPFVSGIPSYKYTNVTEAELYGFDAAADFAVTKNITLFGDIAYVVGIDRDTDNKLSNIPPLNGKLGARWDDKLGKIGYYIELSADMYASQDKVAAGEEKSKSYNLANIRTGVKIPELGFLRNTSVTLNVENLFDKQYYSHMRKSDSDLIAGQGLNVTGAFQFSF